MKIGVSSYSYEAYRRETGSAISSIPRLAKRAGYEGIEFTEIPADEVRDVKRACEDQGLPIAAYTVGADFLADPGALDGVKRQIDIARELGAPVMRHDLSYSARPRARWGWREAVKAVAPYVRQAADYAARAGITTCCENHGLFFQDPECLDELMREVDRPNFGWLVDMGNFLCADRDPVSSVAIAAPWAVHVHAKDFLRKDGPAPSGWFATRAGKRLRGTVAGHGIVDIPGCVAILKAAGYDGWISYEFEGWEENLRAVEAALEYLKTIL